jgi:alcohol dehydrogenase (cytochrome c)
MRRAGIGWRAIGTLSFVMAASVGPASQVSSDRLTNARSEPKNWLTYSGTYDGWRYSTLAELTPSNVRNLELKWLLQAQVAGPWEASPIVVDDVMYVTQRPNDVVALDARTGRIFWIYRYAPAAEPRVCCGAQNRGLAILGHTLFMGTLDAHLVAIDARTGRQLWKTKVGEADLAYSVTHAPLVVKDKVIIGVGGGDWGIRGFIAAYDAKTGRQAWRFDTIPSPGQPGAETWTGDAWKNGGGSVWLTGTYDPALNLTYWGTGNPGPDYNPAQRPGDNLYTDAVVALDADSGALKWHFQFTPADAYDYDAAQVPVLVDTTWPRDPARGERGAPARLMLFGNRNGFFYVIDRVTGKFLSGTPFVRLNWASGLDAAGRPIQTPQAPGAATSPHQQGATNWYSPSYSPRTGLFYMSIWEDISGVFRSQPQVYEPGRTFHGGGMRVAPPVPDAATPPFLTRGAINTWTDAVGRGAVVAIDPATGERRWTRTHYDLTDAGVLTTASDLLFTGSRDGYFLALDARTGALLWQSSLGSPIRAAPATFQAGGRQFVTIISGGVLAAYGLRE